MLERPDLDRHQLDDDDVVLVCVLLPAFVSVSADAGGGERSGWTDRHAQPAVSPRPASHTNTQTTHQPPPVRQIHKHIFSPPLRTTHFSGSIRSVPPLLQFRHLAKLVQSWLNCYYWPILAAIQFAQFVQNTRYWRDFIANLICKKHPDIADSPLESASSQLMEGPISM